MLPFSSVKYALSEVCHNFHWMVERLFSGFICCCCLLAFLFYFLVFLNSDNQVKHSNYEAASVSTRILRVWNLNKYGPV